jgi:hypothetical protein
LNHISSTSKCNKYLIGEYCYDLAVSSCECNECCSTQFKTASETSEPTIKVITDETPDFLNIKPNTACKDNSTECSKWLNFCHSSFAKEKCKLSCNSCSKKQHKKEENSVPLAKQVSDCVLGYFTDDYLCEGSFFFKFYNNLNFN